jgi:predicted AAA+ superfamily ATPase
MNTITISGPAGCGKSTLIGLLNQRLSIFGYEDIVFVEKIAPELTIRFSDNNLSLMDLINAIRGEKRHGSLGEVADEGEVRSFVKKLSDADLINLLAGGGL